MRVGHWSRACSRPPTRACASAFVQASTGKSTRAEPVAHLFEAGRAWLHVHMPELEAQLLGMIAGGGHEGPGQSPDRADAMVWGVSELMKERAEAQVRVV